DQFVTGLEQYTGVIFGAFLLVFTLFLPNGLVERVRSLGLVRERRVRGDDEPQDLPPLAAQPNTEQLIVDGVARAFGGVKAVDGIDLVVLPGRIHGLIGSNGSGKTTLLNLVSGFYRLDAGEIRIGERRLSGRSNDAIARAGVARTFQTPKLIG